MNMLASSDNLGDGSSGLSRDIDVVGTGSFVEPQFGNDFKTLFPAMLGVGRAKKNRLQDLLSLESVADSALARSAFSAADLGNAGEVDTLGRDLAINNAAGTEEADAFASGGVTNDTFLSDEVKLGTVECEDWGHLRGALSDGDDLTAHLDEEKTCEGK
jgi:hypothetical protein